MDLKQPLKNECIKENLELLGMFHKKSLTSLSNDDSTPQNKTAAEEISNCFNDLTGLNTCQPAFHEERANEGNRPEENVESVEDVAPIETTETVVPESIFNDEDIITATINVTELNRNSSTEILTENNVKLPPIGKNHFGAFLLNNRDLKKYF
jgi:hypothetical protein